MVGTDWREAQCSPSAEGDGVPGIACKHNEEDLVKGVGKWRSIGASVGKRKRGGAGRVGRLFEERLRYGVNKVQEQGKGQITAGASGRVA